MPFNPACFTHFAQLPFESAFKLRLAEEVKNDTTSFTIPAAFRMLCTDADLPSGRFKAGLKHGHLMALVAVDCCRTPLHVTVKS
jgi:hypothetical protein